MTPSDHALAAIARVFGKTWEQLDEREIMYVRMQCRVRLSRAAKISVGDCDRVKAWLNGAGRK
jgi:hypothetical protein